MPSGNMEEAEIDSDESLEAQEDDGDLESELLLFNENQAALIRNMSLVNHHNKNNSSMQIFVSDTISPKSIH